MSILGKIGSVLTGGVASKIGTLLDELHVSGEEKQAFILKHEELLQARASEVEQTIRQELEVSARIIEAEMASGDNYTKRARPTIVYVGLALAVAKAVLSGWGIEITIPIDFWYVWGSVCAVWSVGRSAEKRGSTQGERASRAMEMVMGKRG